MLTNEEYEKRMDEYTRSMVGTLGIRFLSREKDGTLRATMPVDHRTRRPGGILAGGASLALAETVAGFASLRICPKGKQAFGIQISANHIAMVKEGDTVTATASPIHLGRTTHIWNVDVRSSENKLISSVRVTNFICDIKL